MGLHQRSHVMVLIGKEYTKADSSTCLIQTDICRHVLTLRTGWLCGRVYQAFSGSATTMDISGELPFESTNLEPSKKEYCSKNRLRNSRNK